MCHCNPVHQPLDGEPHWVGPHVWPAVRVRAVLSPVLAPPAHDSPPSSSSPPPPNHHWPIMCLPSMSPDPFPHLHSIRLVHGGPIQSNSRAAVSVIEEVFENQRITGPLFSSWKAPFLPTDRWVAHTIRLPSFSPPLVLVVACSIVEFGLIVFAAHVARLCGTYLVGTTTPPMMASPSPWRPLMLPCPRAGSGRMSGEGACVLPHTCTHAHAPLALKFVLSRPSATPVTQTCMHTRWCCAVVEGGVCLGAMAGVWMHHRTLVATGGTTTLTSRDSVEPHAPPGPLRV